MTEETPETRVESNHVSCGLLQSTPLALNELPSAPRTVPMIHGANIARKYKTKTRKGQTKRKESNDKGEKDKRFAESMISVNDHCQGRELNRK